MRRLAAPGLCLVAAVLVSCGGKGGSPAKPTPTAVSVSITPADDFMLIGENIQFSATVTFSDGSTSSQPGTWGSDTPMVATVDTTGKVTPVSWGKVTIYVDIQGHRGTRLITVMPNFKGEWHGRFVVDKCTATGTFKTIDFCDGVAGGSDAMVLHLTQNRTTLSGTLEFPTCPCSGDITGSVGDDAGMTVTGTILSESVLLTVKNWATRSDQPGVMTGKFTLNWTVPGASGAANWDSHLVGVVRTSGGPAGLEPAPETMPPGAGSLFDVMRRLSAGGLR
jgi:Bacterial Ig-like domain (group 2)